jgi:hypothetical protein
MEQDPDLAGFATLGDFAAAGLPPGEEYRVARVAEGLRFDPEASVATASGGERRRAALARLLAAEPELMMLDEPTNHLDITAIGWLEARAEGHAGGGGAHLARPGLPARAHPHDALARPGPVAPQRPGIFRLRGLARPHLGRRGRPAPQARTQDQGRGAVGRRGHQRPAQAQPGPGARASGAAHGAGRDDPPPGPGRDGLRETGARPARRSSRHRAYRRASAARRSCRASPSAWRGATGWPSWARTAWARRRS